MDNHPADLHTNLQGLSVELGDAQTLEYSQSLDAMVSTFIKVCAQVGSQEDTGLSRQRKLAANQLLQETYLAANH